MMGEGGEGAHDINFEQMTEAMRESSEAVVDIDREIKEGERLIEEAEADLAQDLKMNEDAEQAGLPPLISEARIQKDKEAIAKLKSTVSELEQMRASFIKSGDVIDAQKERMLKALFRKGSTDELNPDDNR